MIMSCMGSADSMLRGGLMWVGRNTGQNMPVLFRKLFFTLTLLQKRKNGRDWARCESGPGR